MAWKIDHDHPLYLSTSDVPGAVQIGIQLTGMENYTLWSRAMELTLLTKNKLGFVDGSITRERYTTNSEKKQWDRCNAMVLSWFMSNRQVLAIINRRHVEDPFAFNRFIMPSKRTATQRDVSTSSTENPPLGVPTQMETRGRGRRARAAGLPRQPLLRLLLLQMLI